jgi:hypothetical protein
MTEDGEYVSIFENATIRAHATAKYRITGAAVSEYRNSDQTHF